MYCHNPDTWKISEPSREVTVDEMVNEILPYKPYFDASGGGVTVSGGEPLLQMPFLEKLFAELLMIQKHFKGILKNYKNIQT